MVTFRAASLRCVMQGQVLRDIARAACAGSSDRCAGTPGWEYGLAGDRRTQACCRHRVRHAGEVKAGQARPMLNSTPTSSFSLSAPNIPEKGWIPYSVCTTVADPFARPSARLPWTVTGLVTPEMVTSPLI